MGIGEDTADEERLATRLGVADRIVFAGKLDDAIEALHAADLYAMPSLHEGFSIATIEAFAVGLPVLLTDVPGLREVGQFFAQVTFSATDAEALAARLRELVATPAEALAHGARDYPAVARQAFAPERGVAQYVALYGRAGRAGRAGR